ncbi:MAG: signal peptidase I [Actinobacteria bacterium]|jgi:signal peptidase I|uniref:signal peptidase I n=1 Tax=freshwater metagenome TaxID=449393 RepID=A0A6J6A6T2_9ZZZZ|nr:signal peptidase I [Actinomycetota bacterium]MSW77470.1 signal peptidase I [Actinomycetota bacterium]MSX54396.1 signal peptidase I [Actinomycetota bacterium]MSX93381.1 signal peptidase I [Actinomycetota bacterium]MSZ82606.1 signal peptidase I [Actinomycetota bacterium]
MSDDQYRSAHEDSAWASDPAAVGIDTIDPVDGDNTGAAQSKSKRKGSSWIEWFVVIIIAVTAALLVRQFVLQQFAVSGSSMYSTLHDGDRVLVNKLSYRMHDPRRGDVVVLKTLESVGERDLIKRVVALPGEKVEYRSCVLYVDGRTVAEPYLDPKVVAPTNCGGEQSSLTIPADSVFVMGDNRGGSKDSRDLGPISYSDIIGRAFVVIWPYGDWRWL